MSSISILFFFVGVSLSSVSADGDFVLPFNGNKFSSEVTKESNNFVMFYAPWCGHCKRLHPTWDSLAKKYNKEGDRKEVTIANVDCTVETSLCSDHDVTGYPTLKFFKKGAAEDEKPQKYRGQRDLDTLVKYVEKQLGKEVEEKEEALGEPEIPTAENGLYVLGEKSFSNFIQEGDTFVKFYAPWCGHCQKLAPVWNQLAEKFSSGSPAKVAKLDCTSAQGVCQENDVKGYPTLAYFRNGKKIETYRGGRTLGDLSDYIDSMKDGKAEPADTKDKVPTEKKEEDVSAVTVLTNDDFQSTIEKDGLVFVKFYAPWCGHCKRLAPTWDDLAKKMNEKENVVVAKVDCTSNENKNKELCDGQGVSGFPTLNLYKNGKKVTEYSGKRSLDDLVKFVEENLKKEKEEL